MSSLGKLPGPIWSSPASVRHAQWVFCRSIATWQEQSLWPQGEVPKVILGNSHFMGWIVYYAECKDIWNDMKGSMLKRSLGSLVSIRDCSSLEISGVMVYYENPSQANRDAWMGGVVVITHFPVASCGTRAWLLLVTGLPMERLGKSDQLNRKFKRPKHVKPLVQEIHSSKGTI